jgi:hypothetical protein
MSYEKMRSFSFSKDFTSFTTVHASNNIYPLDYYKTVVNKKDDKTVLDFVSGTIAIFMGRSYQMNNKNNIIDYMINKYEQVYKSSEAFNDYINCNWRDEKEKDRLYNIYVSKTKECSKAIANSLIKNEYKAEFNNLKKEKYYLKYLGNYVTSFSNRSFRYLNSKNSAKIFTGIQKETLKNHFIVTEYNCVFEKVEA